MSQEINIKLRADTREAVQSVKDLERQVAGINKMERKGEDDKNFLNQDDVKRFRRMSEDAERVYRDFFEKYNRIQRDFEQKKEELTRAQSRGASSTVQGNLERQIRELEAQRNIYQSQIPQVNTLHGNRMTSEQNINNMGTNGGAFNGILATTRRMLPLLGLTLGAGALMGFAKDGMRQIKVDEDYMSTLGQRVPGYAGDFEKGRLEAEAVGLKDGNAYKALESMQVAENFTSIAGARSKDEMWAATNEIQTTGRVLGIDPSELATQTGELSRWGAFDSKSLKGFRDAMVGAIKETGMSGRDREFAQAVSGLTNQVARGQLEYSNEEFNQTLGLQTLLGRADEAFKGERGAEVLSQIDAGVKGNDNAVDIMLGWGSEFQGIEGRAELERMKAKGISDPEVSKRLFSNIDGLGGGNKDYQALWLQDKFGLSMEQSDRLLQDDILSQLKKGGLSKKDIDAMLEEGGKESEKKQGFWQNSQAQRRAENDADWENTKKFGGSPLDKAWNWGKDQFFEQSKPVQWAEMLGGVGAGAWLGAKGLGALSRRFGGRVGGSAAGGGSMLSKAGKFLGPVGSILGLSTGAAIGTDMGDWLFGHQKGQKKEKRGLRNPFGDMYDGVYKDDKQGAISKAWDWVTGADNKAEAAELTPEDQELFNSKVKGSTEISKKEQLVSKESDTLLKRKSQTEKEKVIVDKESRNIEEFKTLFSSGSDGIVSKLIDGMKRFFQKVVEYFKGLFSDLGGGGGILGALGGFFGLDGGGSTGSDGGGPSNFKGNTNTEKAWSFFKGKGFTDEAVAGILGNLQQESPGLDPKMKQHGGGPGRGIMQWEKGDRWDKLVSWAKKNGKDPESIEAQLEYMWIEMNGGDSTGVSKLNKKYGGMDGLKSAKDPHWAATAFEDSFERAGKPNMSARHANADAFLDEYGGKTVASKDTKTKAASTWDDKTSGVMNTSSGSSTKAASNPGTSNKLEVVVSGKVDGLTKENNNVVTRAIANVVSNSNIDISKEFRQGIGGKS